MWGEEGGGGGDSRCVLDRFEYMSEFEIVYYY